ncbi:trimeric intracellular cation channel family protein [Mycobacterium sp. HNNTM2301]|uniref:trimeric intracellular cation channel family protein n=1 Tax=Mycobacterium hainanense TaxID=3289775 RepID=UPI0035A5B400
MALAGLTLADLFRAVDLTGVFGNALLGGVVARKEKLDPVGFAALAVLSGLGGGMIRDTLLQRGTPVALTDYAYLLTALAGAAFAFAFRVEGRVWNWVWPVVDALALGCWAATGAYKTLAVGLGWLAALLLGTISAVGGGATRDIVMRRVPGIFGGNTLYATCALAASGALVLFDYRDHPTPGLLVGALTGTVLCWLAQWRGWMLPAVGAWSPATILHRGRSRRSAPGANQAEEGFEDGDSD